MLGFVGVGTAVFISVMFVLDPISVGVAKGVSDEGVYW